MSIASPRHLAALALLALAGCASSAPAATFRGQPVRPDRFGLVLLLTGEAPPELSDEERGRAFDGHMAFMRAASERGELLLAGPFGEPKEDPLLRGLFLFDASEPEAIAALGAGDPTTAMGVFRQQAMTLDTLDLVRHVPALYQELEQQRAQAGEAGRDMASYTVMIAEDGPAALEAAAGPLFAGSVALLGRLGAPRQDALLGIFTVPDVEEVRARLAASGLDVSEGIELHRWYATSVLQRFAEPGDPAQ